MISSFRFFDQVFCLCVCFFPISPHFFLTRKHAPYETKRGRSRPSRDPMQPSEEKLARKIGRQLDFVVAAACVFARPSLFIRRLPFVPFGRLFFRSPTLSVLVSIDSTVAPAVHSHASVWAYLRFEFRRHRTSKRIPFFYFFTFIFLTFASFW